MSAYREYRRDASLFEKSMKALWLLLAGVTAAFVMLVVAFAYFFLSPPEFLR